MNKTYLSCIKIVACSSIIGLSLAGCQTAYKPLNGNQQDAGAGAQTQGLSSASGYQSEMPNYDDSGRFINSLKAPSKQVYYFDFDASTMKNKDDIKCIEAQAEYLSKHPSAKVLLEGHTDPRGSREYNIGLGWRRVQVIAKYLKQYGVRPDQIKMVSYGKENPDPAENNERAWALNRRVDLNYETY